MRRLATMAVGLAISACGPAWTGKVSGYALDAKESLYVTLTDSKGAALGGLAVLTDQSGMCAGLAAQRAPSSATLAAFIFTRQADGKPLSPDVGDYVVGAYSGATSSSVSALFMRTDLNGTNSIPSTGRGASSGLLKVSELSVARGTMTATFEGKFGVQNDAVTAAVHASSCVIDTKTLQLGFLWRELGFAAAGGQSQSSACAQMISCYGATYGSTSSLEGSYGVGGTCWQSTFEVASSCTNACETTLTSLRSAAGAASVCFQ